MQYETADGSEIEVIWNSRDGVTPFGLCLRSGRQANHVRWHEDLYAPDHKPAAGARVFRDMTIERATEILTTRWQSMIKHDPKMLDHLDKETAIAEQAQEMVEKREPMIEVIT